MVKPVLHAGEEPAMLARTGVPAKNEKQKKFRAAVITQKVEKRIDSFFVFGAGEGLTGRKNRTRIDFFRGLPSDEKQILRPHDFTDAGAVHIVRIGPLRSE